MRLKNRLPMTLQIDLKFSNFCLLKFKRQNEFKMYESHGEELAIQNELPSS